jgi:CelD/BcsL family acetyltransferase involved in cellulose biosynthesis
VQAARAARSPSMDILRSFRDFAGIQQACDALADRRHNPFLRYDWLLSCLQTLHDEAQLHIVVRREGGEVTAVAPLVAVRQHGHERLEIAGTALLLEPCGLLYRDDAALAGLTRELVALGRPLLLRGQAVGGDTEQALRRTMTDDRSGLLLLRGSRTTHVVPMHESFPAFMKSLSSKMRQDVRRLWARADTLGRTRVDLLHPTPADVSPLMDTIVAVESAGWKRGAPTSLAQHDGLRRFFGALALRAAAAGTLRVGLLRIGATVAAAQLSIEACGRLWVLKMGFDESTAWCSPGFLLMHESIRDAHERRLDAVELLGSAEPWQERWRPESRLFRSTLVYPYTVRGLSSFAMDAIGRGARQMLASTRGV